MAENISEIRRRDALALAQIIYNIFKKRQASANIKTGQNNENQPKNN